MEIGALASRARNVAVLDEAQAIKNSDSQSARAAYRLPAKLRLTLTGTPVENRLEELWSQMHFSNPGLLGEKKQFEERYAKPISAGDQDRTERLRERLRPFVLRRLKRVVAPELPPRTDLVLRCELNEAERGAYDAIRLATQKEVVARLGTGANPLAALNSREIQRKVVKGDRPTAIVAEAPKRERVLQVPTMTQEDGVGVVRKRPFAFVEAPLAVAGVADLDYPPFNPLRVVSTSNTKRANIASSDVIYSADIAGDVRIMRESDILGVVS